MTSGEMTLVRLDQLPLNTHSSIPTMRLHGRLRPCSSRAAEMTSGLFVDTWRPEIPSCCIRCPMNPLFINFTPSPPHPFFFYLPLQTTFNLLSFKLLNPWQRGRNSRELQWHFLFSQKSGNCQSKALSWGDLEGIDSLCCKFPEIWLTF